MENNGGGSNIPAPPNPAAPGSITLSPEQFQQLISSIVARNALPAAASLQPAANSQHTPEERFRPQDLGFFDPDSEARPTETTDGKTTYHNVFSFTARIRVKTQQVTSGPWTSANLAAKLDQCLKGKAELWYTNEISATTRAGLKTGIDLWCTELEVRFRDAPGAALEKLESLRYTVRDARARRDPEDFVQNIIVQAQNAGTALTEYAQMLTAYQHLDAALRVTITAPTEATRMTEFIKQLTAAKSVWFDLYKPFGDFNTNRPQPMGFRHTRPHFPPQRQGYQWEEQTFPC
jgi:hypothetical protein